VAALLMGVAASAMAEKEIDQKITGDIIIDAFVFQTCPDGSEPLGVERFKFEAERQFDLHSKYGGVEVQVQGDVTCVVIVGNRARVGAMVRQSDFGAGIPVGSQLAFSVTDNSGKETSPDFASQLLGVTKGYDYCNFGLPYPEYPLRRGKIRIKE
jgi:hypothetical protein